MHMSCRTCCVVLVAVLLLCIPGSDFALPDHVTDQCSFSSLTECFLHQLGPPHTPQEWMLAYISAVAERCLTRPLEACNSDPACTMVSSFYHKEVVEMVAAPDPEGWLQDWLQQQGLEADDLYLGCRADVLRVLGKPCKGSRDDLLVRCGGHGTAGECTEDKACLWLRNGWWFDPNSHQANAQKATLFSGVDVVFGVDNSVLLQGGVPPTYACWPKWHVPYAAQAWPGIQSKAKPEPLMCPLAMRVYPCTIDTEASFEADDMPVAELLTSNAQCIDIAGIKGTCPHVDLAAQVVKRLWDGWEMPIELLTNLTLHIDRFCEPVDSKLRFNHSRQTFQMAATRALPFDPGVWQHLDTVIGKPVASVEHLYGSDCAFDSSYYASYAPVDLPVQCRDIMYESLLGRLCNMQPIDKRRSKDGCVEALLSVGLWGEFAAAVLAPSSKSQSGFWLKGLVQAGRQCGMLENWHRVCNVSSVRQDAYLGKLVGDYEKLFLVDANAAVLAKTVNVMYACHPGITAAYKSLAAVWIAYAGVLVLGLVGLAVYWSLCENRRRLRARQAAAALQSLLASQPGMPNPQRTTLQKVWSIMYSTIPRCRAVAFAVDLGLDVYTLVQLWSSRWFGHMLSAVLLPYIIMGLLVGPGFGKLGRSDYPYLLGGVCLCSLFCWPAIWWLDVRMLFSLMGVQLPCCGESNMAMAPYTDLRMLFQGVFEALLSALVSTAVLYDKLGVQSSLAAIPVTLLWLNLVSSFSRGLLEVWKLAVLTHVQGHWCFITTIANMVWDMLPMRDSPTTAPGQMGQSMMIATAPRPLIIAPQDAQQQAHDAKDTQDEDVVAKASSERAVTPKGSDIHSGCECCCWRNNCAAPKGRTYCWVLAWVWLWVVGLSGFVVVLSISIGCVGLLVQDGVISLVVISLPRYRFAGDVTCGAGSLFGALHSGASASCTLPNLVAYK